MPRQCPLNVDVNLQLTLDGSEIAAKSEGSKLIVETKRVKGLLSLFKQRHSLNFFKPNSLFPNPFKAIEIRLGRFKVARLLERKGLLPIQIGDMWVHPF